LVRIFTRYAMGQLLSISENRQVCHVRVFSERDGEVIVNVGHLPIDTALLVRDVAEVHEPAAIADSAVRYIEEWKAARAQGKAGAFSVSLASSVELIWKTVRERAVAHESNAVIASAFPVVSAQGDFRVVRVILESGGHVVGC
jgi:hypothetical protein